MTSPIQTQGHLGTQKYVGVNSQNLISELNKFDLIHTKSSFGMPRKEEKRGFQKHIMTFEHPDFKIDDHNKLQLLVTNSHDGSTSLRFNLGIFRLVCSNGLVVGSNFYESRFNHSQGVLSSIDAEVNKITNLVPSVMETVKRMAETPLTPEQIEQFQLEATRFRVEDDRAIPERNTFAPRRYLDRGHDLYKVYNVIQEVCMRGGLQHRIDGVFKSTRSVRGVEPTLKINQGLWDMASKLLVA